MPRFLLPRRSSAHRIAAIALYRALLTQCRALASLEAHQRHELQNIVRNRFKQARFTHSLKWLQLDFEAGYEAIDHLDAAVACREESRSYILDLLRRAPEKAKQNPHVVLTKRQQKALKKCGCHEENDAQEKREQSSRPSILERPLPLEKLSGRRHVPVLFNAQGVPVLRIKKPQPQSLSSYINDKLKRKQKRNDTRHRLDAEFELAYAEDAWDDIITSEYVRMDTWQGQGLSADTALREPRWKEAVDDARRENLNKVNAERRKNREMAERMQDIVDRERELYEKEKVERVRAKKQRSRAKLP